MKELNLTVGQKCWSIQLGECVVDAILDTERHCFRCLNLDKQELFYTKKGQIGFFDKHPSLFESNPFEPKLVQETVQENKAELINALSIVCNVFKSGRTHILASNKLLKLLESI